VEKAGNSHDGIKNNRQKDQVWGEAPRKERRDRKEKHSNRTRELAREIPLEK